MGALEMQRDQREAAAAHEVGGWGLGSGQNGARKVEAAWVSDWK